jgi:AcrR family transcriptional regulator
MTTRLPAAERRAQLLDVALRVFGEQGFHDTSMNDIAETAGVTKPVLYQHFGSKRALYLEVLREVGGRLRDAVGKATASAASPHQQVERGFHAYFTWVGESRSGFDVLFAGETRRDREFVAEALRVENGIADVIAELIVVEGLTEERRRLLAYAIVGLAETTSRHWLSNDLDLGAAELAQQCADLAWAGLRGLRA